MHTMARGVTLMELVVAIVLMSVVVLGVSNIDVFSRYQVVSSERRAKLQNDASYAIEHMAKQISRAIGDKNSYPVTKPDANTIAVRIDSNGNSRLDPATDKRIAYRLDPLNHILRYSKDFDADLWDPLPLSEKASSFVFSYSPANNYVFVSITACHDPAGTCHTFDNPDITLETNIKMPSVSVN